MFLVGSFFLFSAFLVTTCIFVIFSKNPVNSVLFLVLAFLNSTFLFILIGAEFVGIILAIVYIGAVAILFLFVVMMLDIQKVTLMLNIKKYVPIAVVFASIILAEIIYLTVYKTTKVNPNIIIKYENNTEYKKDIIKNTFINKRQYIVQNLYSIDSQLEIYIANPTSKIINVFFDNKIFKMEPFNCKIIKTNLNKISLKSDCMFLRPIIFESKKEFLNVHHG